MLTSWKMAALHRLAQYCKEPWILETVLSCWLAPNKGSASHLTWGKNIIVLPYIFQNTSEKGIPRAGQQASRHLANIHLWWLTWQQQNICCSNYILLISSCWFDALDRCRTSIFWMWVVCGFFYLGWGSLVLKSSVCVFPLNQVFECCESHCSKGCLEQTNV